MPQLPPLPAAGLAPAKSVSNKAAGADSAQDGGASFGEVLDAQLGISKGDTPILAGPVAVIAADKGDAKEVKDAAAVDPTSGMLPTDLLIPTIPMVQTSAVNTAQSDEASGNASVTLDADALRTSLLADAAKVRTDASSATVDKATDPAAATDSATLAVPDRTLLTAAADTSAATAPLPVARLKAASNAQTDTSAVPASPQLQPHQPQPAAVTPTQQPTNAAIPGTVGDARWSDAFSQRVMWMANDKVQAAEFRVEPPQLGPIEVRLSITNDQANLLINAPHAVAREAIQTSLPRLQEMLEQSGLTLGNVAVGAHTQQNRNNDQRFDQTSGRDRSVNGTTSTTSPVMTSSSLIRSGRGLVDLFA